MKKQIRNHKTNIFAFIALAVIFSYKPTPITEGQIIKDLPKHNSQIKDSTKNAELIAVAQDYREKSDSLDSIKAILFSENSKNQQLIKKKLSKPVIIIKEKPVLVQVPILVHPPDTGYVEQSLDSSGKDYLPVDSIAPKKKKDGWVKRLFRKRN